MFVAALAVVLLVLAWAAGYTTGRYGARNARHQRDRWSYWPTNTRTRRGPR